MKCFINTNAECLVGHSLDLIHYIYILSYAYVYIYIHIYIYIDIFCTDPATDIYQGMPALGCHERT